MTADWRGRRPAGGLVLQSGAADAHVETSEALFVTGSPLDALPSAAEPGEAKPNEANSSEAEPHAANSNAARSRIVGHALRVRGIVRELKGRTTVVADRVSDCGPRPLPDAVDLDRWQAAAGAHVHEAVEAMRVSSELEWVLTDLGGWGTTGEVRVARARGFVGASGAGSSRSSSGTPEATPDDGAGERPGLRDVVLLPVAGARQTKAWSVDRLVRSPRLGDVARGWSGTALADEYGLRVELTQPPSLESRNPRPAAPARVEQTLRIAAINVRNYFVHLGARGARTVAERERQRAKLTAALVGLDADVVAVIEIENAGTLALDDLTLATNARGEGPPYAVVPLPTWTGSDAIGVGFMYRPSVVRWVSGAVWNDTSVVHRRPPLAATFESEGGPLSVVVQHAKSRSCAGARGVQRDFGFGCYDVERRAQIDALLAFVRDVRERAGSDRVVLLGDFNAYPFEPPIAAVEAEGWRGEIGRHVDANSAYSFVYDGRAGLLDHVFTSPSLSASVVRAGIWHIAADEPPVLDYREANPPGAFQPDAFRASDHDPAFVDLWSQSGGTK